jgi:hypothetical protein
MAANESKFLTAKHYIPIVAARAGTTHRVAVDVVNAWRVVLSLELANGHAVQWWGVGTFYPHVEYNTGEWGVGAANNRRYKIATIRIRTSRALRRLILPLADRNITAGTTKMGRLITPGAVKGRLHVRVINAQHQLDLLKRVVGDDERAAELEARLEGTVKQGRRLLKKKANVIT